MKHLFIIIPALLVVAIVACGPSVRRTYQSDNAFERCFDMDFNPGASIDEKQRCWLIWKQKYVYNQPKDKRKYADLRIEELEKGVSMPAPPGPPGAFDQRPVPNTDTGQEVHAVADTDCTFSCKDALSSCLDVCGLSTDSEPSDNCTGACSAGYLTCFSNCKN